VSSLEFQTTKIDGLDIESPAFNQFARNETLYPAFLQYRVSNHSRTGGQITWHKRLSHDFSPGIVASLNTKVTNLTQHFSVPSPQWLIPFASSTSMYRVQWKDN